VFKESFEDISNKLKCLASPAGEDNHQTSFHRRSQGAKGAMVSHKF